MNSAEKLFRNLESLSTSVESGETAEQRFLDYCRDVLGSVERLHFDFKQKTDSTHPRLEQRDKRNLARALSGFSNSAGGLLIWGIADDTIEPKPIQQVDAFLTNMLELAPNSTEPTLSGIDGFSIHNDAADGSGFAVLFVPESVLPPHRVALNISEIRGRYYVRSGSTFFEATHTQLEDMFGRRPRPDLEIAKSFIIRHGRAGEAAAGLLVVVGIQNRGRGAARAPFMALEVAAPYSIWRFGIDGNGNFGLPELKIRTGAKERWFGSFVEPIIHSGMTLDVAGVEVELRSRKEPEDLVINYRIAADGIRPIEGQLVVTGQELLAEATPA